MREAPPLPEQQQPRHGKYVDKNDRQKAGHRRWGRSHDERIMASTFMAEIRFHFETKLAPEAVLAVLTDFGPGRAKVWPNIDDQHFRVHGHGPGWADVTEGSSIAGGVWEREKYAWDATQGYVVAETIDSNTWGPGSGWNYKLTPTKQGGTEIDVTIKRYGKGWKGRLIELGLAAAGSRVMRSQMEQALARSAP